MLLSVRSVIFLSARIIYEHQKREHQQREHINLISVLESVAQKFHTLPFHTWICNNTPVKSLKEKAHEMLWNQNLIHMSLQIIKEIYKFVDGVPNLSNFDFDNITKCLTCIKADL